MNNNCNDKGVEKHMNISIINNNNNNNNTVVSEMSLYDGIKEEKACSFQEREEDVYQLQKQQQHQQQFKPLNGYRSGCESQQNENQPKEKTQEKNLSHDEEEEEEQQQQQETELLELRKRLECLRKRRRRIQQSTRIECIHQQDLLLKRLNARKRNRTQIVDEYVSAWKERDSVALFLDCAKRWNVLNDCFSIWIDGKSAFATINGCRLGAEAASLPSELLISAQRGQGQPKTKSNNGNGNGNGKWVISATNNANATTNGNRKKAMSPHRRGILGLFGSNDSANNNIANTVSEKGSTIPATILEPPIRVPFMEINAALGHACLLLKILQESFSKKAGEGMKFTHELHPMGATSKIGIRFGSPGSGAGVLAAAAGFGSILSNGNNNNNNSENDVAPVVYNLFFEEDSGFSFFKKNARNFNWALQAFVQCIAEAAAQQADKTIAIPHIIQHKKATSASKIANNNNNSIDNSANYLNGGEWTIGGLSICYPSQLQTAAGGNPMAGEGGLGLAAAAARNATTSAMSLAALEWTRACRFLLTDLKWLVAYAAKHVDR
jgi:hypothetical protein